MIADVAALVIEHEGFRAAKYQDDDGNWTIGYGHNLDAMPLAVDLLEADGTISEATAGEVLEDDLAKATTPLYANLPWFQTLDPVRQAVLIDMSFNLGWPKLSAFVTFLKLMAAGDYGGAAADLQANTAWAKQVPARAAQDCAMLIAGQWPPAPTA